VQELGWRVPLSTDFDALWAAIGGKATGGGELKELGLTHWNVPNTGALDEYGFTALPGGVRNYSAPLSTFMSINTDAYFSCSDVFDVNNNNCARFVHNSAEAYMTAGSKKNGVSIRCVRDLGTTTAAQTTLL
jgi:uncharacterized protein (TIGR02145 family)